MIFEAIFTVCVSRTLLCVLYTSFLSSLFFFSFFFWIVATKNETVEAWKSSYLNKLYDKQAFFLHHLLGKPNELPCFSFKTRSSHSLFVDFLSFILAFR